jgi:hypothetical protein
MQRGDYAMRRAASARLGPIAPRLDQVAAMLRTVRAKPSWERSAPTRGRRPKPARPQVSFAHRCLPRPLPRRRAAPRRRPRWSAPGKRRFESLKSTAVLGNDAEDRVLARSARREVLAAIGKLNDGRAHDCASPIFASASASTPGSCRATPRMCVISCLLAAYRSKATAPAIVVGSV